MRFAVLASVLMVGMLSYAADQWEFFHPELVTSMSCSVQDVIEQAYGEQKTREIWRAEAQAERSTDGKWSMTVGQFPHTLKGRHEAEKSCSKWMDDATKRVKAAR